MIDIETKRILNRFADIADRYVAVQEKYYKLISEPGFVASEPKSSCCSIHAGSGEECVDSVSNNSPKVDWSKAKINEDFRNVSYKFEVKQPEECGHEWTAVFTPLPFPVTKIKCKLCGEFYK